MDIQNSCIHNWTSWLRWLMNCLSLLGNSTQYKTYRSNLDSVLMLSRYWGEDDHPEQCLGYASEVGSVSTGRGSHRRRCWYKAEHAQPPEIISHNVTTLSCWWVQSSSDMRSERMPWQLCPGFLTLSVLLFSAVGGPDTRLSQEGWPRARWRTQRETEQTRSSYWCSIFPPLVPLAAFIIDCNIWEVDIDGTWVSHHELLGADESPNGQRSLRRWLRLLRTVADELDILLLDTDEPEYDLSRPFVATTNHCSPSTRSNRDSMN